MPLLVRSAPFIARASTSQSVWPSVPGYSLVARVSAGRWFELFTARAVGQSGRFAPDYVVKYVRDGAPDDHLPRAMLRREVNIAALVAHPNLVSVLDSGLNENCPFIILPYLPGRPLEQLATARTQTPVPQALWYARQVAAALAALHQAGWLHGDVKPANIIVSDQGHATLIDLGLARRLDSPECRTDNWLTGDAAYLAPEAFQPQRSLTAAADVYALGLTLLNLLRGNRWFSLRESTSFRGAKGDTHPLVDSWRTVQDLRVSRPDVPRELALLLAKMLAKEPLRRPSAGELVENFSALEIESLMQWQ